MVIKNRIYVLSRQGSFAMKWIFTSSPSRAVEMSNLMSIYRSIGVHDGKGLKASFLFKITGPLTRNAFILNKWLMVNI